ncbi:MAG: acyl-CoA dehydrogenase [Gammaproteobacteria bacterium]
MEMLALSLFVLTLIAVWVLAYQRSPLLVWTGVLGVALVLATIVTMGFTIPLIIAWGLWALLGLMNLPEVRRRVFSAPLLSLYRKRLPRMSSTEREALEAGSVWWDGELFSGDPDWQRLLELPAYGLSPEEQAFVDGPTEDLCKMLDDWKITHELNDLPGEAWQFIKDKGFFGMIIPKGYGGLGFSAQLHSAVVSKIASRCGSAAVTVMVPNSLGPAELLMRYGTDEQKSHYLPRLASGAEIPCFGLTNPYAGSDAGSIPDYGIVCHDEYRGNKVLGLRLTWEKRYITLGPVATVLGLAFQAHDPDHILGDVEELGITLALIPTDHPGVNIGRRHYPAGQAFQNGPNWGKDVFIPMEMVIGGQARLGQGWRMLMNCLAAGRAISLPALATAAAKLCARTSGAYARIRKQFKVPIGKFEGVEEALARIAGETYAIEAARRVTLVALDQGHEPAVVSALLKYQVTERQRRCVNDAMDIHGGRAILDGPSNYLARMYQAVPISITVEGANMLTRGLIVFGQGAIRCHPWLFKEIEAAVESDAAKALAAFDEALCGHIGFIVNNLARALAANLSGGRIGSDGVSNPLRYWYRQVHRLSVTFAAVSDLALLLLGGELKRREKLSGRFADILGEMYFMSCALKRFEDGGRHQDDTPLVEWVCRSGMVNVQHALDGILQNFPSRVLAWVLRAVVFPLGKRQKPPSDALTHQIAAALLEPSEARERLTAGIYVNADPQDILGRLEHALKLMPQVEMVEHKINSAIKEGRLKLSAGMDRAEQANAAKLIDAGEWALLQKAEKAIRLAIDVDDFEPAESSGVAQAWPREADVA